MFKENHLIIQNKIQIINHLIKSCVKKITLEK